MAGLLLGGLYMLQSGEGEAYFSMGRWLFFSTQLRGIRSTAGPKRRNAMAITQKWKSKTFWVAFFLKIDFGFVSFLFIDESQYIVRLSVVVLLIIVQVRVTQWGWHWFLPKTKKIASHFLFFFLRCWCTQDHCNTSLASSRGKRISRATSRRQTTRMTRPVSSYSTRTDPVSPFTRKSPNYYYFFKVHHHCWWNWMHFIFCSGSTCAAFWRSAYLLLCQQWLCYLV
jgi:hypothetical protein